MESILSYLMAIQRTAKGIHYRCLGNNFWADHKMADEIFDDIEEHLDEIFEVCYMGREKEVPQEKAIMSGASGLMPLVGEDIARAFGLLDELIVNCLADIELQLRSEQITAGETDVLGRISSDLQKKHGWISRRIRGV